VTDLSHIAPVATRRSDAQRPNVPTLRIAAPLAAIFVLLGNAFKMAYVDPYSSRDRGPQVAPDDDLKGRDPSW
jgi:hypothetical protein